MPLFKRTVVLALLISIFVTCRKPVNVNWDVDLTVPVVNGSLDIKNFFGDSLFTSDNTGLLHFSFNREVFHFKMDSLFRLPDTSIVNSFTIPATTVLQPGQTITTFPPTELEFDIGDDVALKFCQVREGKLNVKFSNDLTEPLDLLYVIPNATKNGVPLTIFASVPPGIHSVNKDYDLAGYAINLRGLSGNVYNTISQAYTLSVNPNSNPVVVTFGKGVKAELSYNDIIPQYIEGYFGKESVEIEFDTARFDIGKTFKASNFMLDDVTMNFKLQNEIGAEFACNLSGINSINSVDQKTVALNSSQLSNININRASKVGTTIFPGIKPLSFTKTNSNIVPFISNLPDKISYQGNVDLNPLGNISGYNDFAFYNTGLRVLAEVDIPMRFTANYFLLSSISEVNFTNAEQLDRVNSGQFVLHAENGYPFSAQMQLYFMDEQHNILDSLFINGQNTIQAGKVNAVNDVIEASKSEIIVPVTSSNKDALKNTKSVKVNAYFLMPPNPPAIKIYDYYKLKINIVAELNYNVKI